jgi:regulator of sigma E protease
MLSLAVFLVILGVLIIVHEFGHFIASKRSGVIVERFSLGFGPKLFSFKRKETLYTICAIPLGGFIKMAGDNLEEYKGAPGEYLTQPIIKRFAIVFSGPLLNYVLGVVLFCLIFFVGYPTLTNKVGETIPGYGAEQAGILPGDRIVAVEGFRVSVWEELQKQIQLNRDKTAVSLSVERDARQFDLSVPLRTQAVEDVLGQRRNMGLVGIKPDVKETIIVRHGALESVSLGVRKSVDLTIMTYKAMWLMVARKMSVKESVTGPLGMFMITSEAAKMGLIALTHLVAVLSISLAIFNLLPLPALDGGHIFLMAVEKIRGKALSQKADMVFNRVGFAFIITLAVLVFYNDLMKYGFVDRILQLFTRRGA